VAPHREEAFSGAGALAGAAHTPKKTTPRGLRIFGGGGRNRLY
jgi:hypothetical protein